MSRRTNNCSTEFYCEGYRERLHCGIYRPEQIEDASLQPVEGLKPLIDAGCGTKTDVINY
jgi:hypothetical protein